MKNLACALLLFVLVFPLQAQFGPGTVETSFSIALQSMSGEGSSVTNLLASGRVGFFVVQGLEIEPEVTLLKPEEGDLCYVLNGNLAYNFQLPSTNAAPFILAGYGITNSIPVFDLPILNVDMTVGVLNLGAGMKVKIVEGAALRVEYRFQKFTGEKTQGSGFYTYTSKIDLTMHTIGAGVSLTL